MTPRLDPGLGYGRLLTLQRDLLREGVEEGLPRLRLALAGTATTSLLPPMLRAFLWPHGLAADLYEAPFGTLVQEVLDPGSGLHAFAPDVAVLLPDASSVLTTDPVEDHVDRWRALWQALLARGVGVLQGNFVLPAESALGHHALRVRTDPRRFLQELNLRLADAAPPGVVLHDTEHLASVLGRTRWREPSYWHAGRMEVAPACVPALAHSLAAVLAALRGRSRRCVVLDLDDTLWGGVVGEVGPEGLALSGTPVGEAHLEFQRYLKALRERGVLLAVLSKNDPEPALRALRERRDMVLREEDFAALEIGWGDKAGGLRRIAATLGLGLDALAFVDDHPGERELVRQLAPEVAVVELPEDPALYVRALDASRLFEPAGLTEEDRSRADRYRAEARRRELRAASGSVESFLRSLHMTLRLAPVDAERLPRVAQLVAKTNQFQLTGRRRTEAALAELLAAPGWVALAGELRDDLGEHGFITAVLAEAQRRDLVIDTWVMSCRVLQRGVEVAVAARLAALARELGLERVVGVYVPSERNGLVRDLYRTLGFAAEGDRWILPVDRAVPSPDWLEVIA